MALPPLWVIASPFSMLKSTNNPPTLMQQGLSNSITPIKFQNQEKEDQEAKTEVTIICNVSQTYVFSYCSKIWRGEMDLQSK